MSLVADGQYVQVKYDQQFPEDGGGWFLVIFDCGTDRCAGESCSLTGTPHVSCQACEALKTEGMLMDLEQENDRLRDALGMAERLLLA